MKLVSVACFVYFLILKAGVVKRGVLLYDGTVYKCYRADVGKTAPVVNAYNNIVSFVFAGQNVAVVKIKLFRKRRLF